MQTGARQVSGNANRSCSYEPASRSISGVLDLECILPTECKKQGESNRTNKGEDGPPQQARNPGGSKQDK